MKRLVAVLFGILVVSGCAMQLEEAEVIIIDEEPAFECFPADTGEGDDDGIGGTGCL